MTLNPLNREDYDIITAMRGPDEETSLAALAKTFTAAIIRHFVDMQRSRDGWAEIHSPEEVMARWETFDPDFKAELCQWFRHMNNYHYITHFEYALHALIQKNVPTALAYQAFYRTELKGIR